MAALALLAATLGGCGGTPEPPPAAQLIEDVRVAMEAAPSFRFEATWTSTDPFSGESITELVGKVAGDGVYIKSGSPTNELDWVGESLFVEGDLYTRSTPPPGGPFGHDWQPARDPQPGAGQSSFRAMFFSIPENLSEVTVVEAERDGADIWVITAERLTAVSPDSPIQYNTSRRDIYSWTIDPNTSRIIDWELATDFGIVTFPADVNATSGPQTALATGRIFDYDADITLTVPPNVTPLSPTPTARPGG